MSETRFTVRSFVNLTNGIEWLKNMPSDVAFCRIESTAIERGDWNRVLRDLDANLLMNLAIGNSCIVFDCGAGREVSKVVSKGIPFIRDFLTDLWIRDVDMEARTPELRALKRSLLYFRRYVRTDILRLYGQSFATNHDGDRAYYGALVEAWRLAPFTEENE